MTATAKVVKAYGMRPVGGFGVRGFRCHCDHCGYLSNCVDNYKRAARWSHKHRCEGEVTSVDARRDSLRDAYDLAPVPLGSPRSMESV